MHKGLHLIIIMMELSVEREELKMMVRGTEMRSWAVEWTILAQEARPVEMSKGIQESGWTILFKHAQRSLVGQEKGGGQAKEQRIS